MEDSREEMLRDRVTCARRLRGRDADPDGGGGAPSAGALLELTLDQRAAKVLRRKTQQLCGADERSLLIARLGRLGLRDAFDAKRAPAWTDRILWRSTPPSGASGPPLRPVEGSYCSVPHLRLSDHRPVCATFTFSLQ